MLIFFFSSCLFVGENFYSTNNISFINFSFSFQFHFSPSSLCSFRSLLLLLNFLEIFIMVFILLVKKLADFDTVPAIFRYKLNYHLISEPFDIKSWMLVVLVAVQVSIIRYNNKSRLETIKGLSNKIFDPHSFHHSNR